METAERIRISEDEYLAFERTSDQKHEFVNGEMWAMAGASYVHNVLVANLVTGLTLALRGRPCRAVGMDMRTAVSETGLYTYPDVVVHCGQPEFHPEDSMTLTNPRVLFEVLSESTEAYDRGAKAAHYRQRASLAEYVLVAQTDRKIEHYRRLETGGWLLTEYGPGESVELPALGCALAVDDVYEGVDALADT